VACERDSVASFQARLEASTSEACCGSFWHPFLKGVQGDDVEVACVLEVASLLYHWEVCHPNLVNFVH